MSIFEKIYNVGDNFTPIKMPDNKKSFALTSDELAFIHALNLQLDSIKTCAARVVMELEKEVNKQTEIINKMKDDFLFALVEKHGLSREGCSLSIDLTNQLFIREELTE